MYPLNRAQISVLKEKDQLDIDGDGNPDCGGASEVDGKFPCGGDVGHSEECCNKGSSGESFSSDGDVSRGGNDGFAGGDDSVYSHTSKDPLSANNLPNSGASTGKENFPSLEKELLYIRRFEEGYNLFNPEYVCWLQEHHPEAVPAGYTTGSNSSVNGCTSKDHFSTNSLQNSGATTGKENIPSVEKELLYIQCFEEGYDIFNPEYICWLQKHHPEAVPAGYTTPKVLNPKMSTHTKATPFGDVSTRDSTSSSNSSGQSSSSGNTISVFFGLLPERTPSRTPTTKNSGARVLTSAECLTLKEEKKKKEKEQRKLTRELNEKMREDQKRKAEESKKSCR